MENNVYKNTKLNFLLKIPTDWDKNIPGLFTHISSIKPGIALLELNRKQNKSIFFHIRYLKGKNINREGIKNYYNHLLRLRLKLNQIKSPAPVKYKFESFPIRGAIVHPVSYDYFIPGKNYSYRFTFFYLKCKDGVLLIESQSENKSDKKSIFASSDSFKLIKKLKLYKDKLP